MLLRNKWTWRILAGILIALLVVQVNNWRVDANKLPIVEKELKDVKESYAKERVISSNHASAIAKELSSTRNRATDIARRLHATEAKCVSIARPPGTDNGTTGESGLSNGSGISAFYLLEDARIATENTQRLVACQKFIKDVWQANGRTY